MSKRVEMFSIYERIWHWWQATTITLLMLTGMEMHWPQIRHIFGFARATWVHEVLALFTIANAFLSLFYHLSTGAIQQFIPKPTDFFSLAIAQSKYYLRDIFKGAPHPLSHGPNSKLNVLQQLTYLFVLNIVLPVQVLSGILMWKVQTWPHLVAYFGGLRVVAGAHIVCAWFTASFLVGHIYMATTGRTPTSLTRAMVLGWDEVDDVHAVAPENPAEAPLK